MSLKKFTNVLNVPKRKVLRLTMSVYIYHMPKVYQYIIEEIIIFNWVIFRQKGLKTLRGNIYSAYVINIKLMNPISVYIADVCCDKKPCD